jgi:RNA polymerase sigma-70 factor (sigma-E family)
LIDDDGFTEYVVARWQRLVRFAVLLGCSEPEAQDVVQTALERCLRKWNKVQDASDPDAYVHGVVLNTFRSARRRSWTRERPAAQVPDAWTPDATQRVDDADAILRALGRLPDNQRAVVLLRYYLHQTEEQTAAALGIASGTVKSRLSRALRSMSADPSLMSLKGTP